MPEKRQREVQRPRRFARLEVRISPDQKALYEKAAALRGRTLTEFVVSCVDKEAKQVLQNTEIITLTGRDRDVFVEALLRPPRANKALVNALKEHARLVESRD